VIVTGAISFCKYCVLWYATLQNIIIYHTSRCKLRHNQLRSAAGYPYRVGRYRAPTKSRRTFDIQIAVSWAKAHLAFLIQLSTSSSVPPFLVT
jgi:hypothetical protein